MNERRFPVLWQCSRAEALALEAAGCPRSVPWSLVAPHARQAEHNHSQTLERLAQRGGLSPAELVAVLRGEGCPFGKADIDAVPALLAALEGS